MRDYVIDYTANGDVVGIVYECRSGKHVETVTGKTWREVEDVCKVLADCPVVK